MSHRNSNRKMSQLERSGSSNGEENEAELISSNGYCIPDDIFDPETNKTYMKGKLLGIGGFARVFQMSELVTGDVYAGKIISKARLSKPEQKEKILKEIRLHKMLSHPNVVKFHHYFEDEVNIYIMLECCSQRSLFQVLRRKRRLEEDEARYFMRQLAEGVRYIHEEQSIVHRDLKLGNLLLSEEMELKIADFGLATRLYEGKMEVTTVCGTPNYIAPEVLNVQGHGFPADVWSMGCILYALLVGQPPFESRTLKETYTRINNNLFSIPDFVTLSARQLILSLLKNDPKARPTASDVLSHEFFSTSWNRKIEPLDRWMERHRIFDRITTNRSAPVVSGVRERVKHLNNSLPALHLQFQPEKTCKSEEVNFHIPPAEEKRRGKFKLSLREKLVNMFSRPKSALKSKTPLTRLRKRLDSCLKNIPIETTKRKINRISKGSILFVTKWMDFSNKFGFGYQLSDDTVGVVFNDGCCLNLLPDAKHLLFFAVSGKKVSVLTENIPEVLKPRLAILRHSARYMEENLIEGGIVSNTRRWKSDSPVYLKKWYRTSNAILMYLSNETVQVNFSDHTKLIMDGSSNGRLMHIDQNKNNNLYSFKRLQKKGCNRHLQGKLRYAAGILQQFMEKEGL